MSRGGSEKQADGRWHHTFHQSWLGGFEKCAEYARRDYAGEFPREETSDTARGTAVHAAIEACLQDVIDGAGDWHVDDMVDFAQAEMTTLLADPTFRWTKIKTEDTIRKQVDLSVRSWYRAVLPTLSPLHTELKFGPLVMWEDDERTIIGEGTIDYVDAHKGLIDWKTGSREYERWERQRWAIQPTFYTWAYHGIPDDGGTAEFPFSYYVMLPSGEIQVLTVTRTAADWAWLARKALNAARMIEAELDEWPLNDASWFCSPRWCEAWKDCKGSHYQKVEWKQ